MAETAVKKAKLHEFLNTLFLKGCIVWKLEQLPEE